MLPSQTIDPGAHLPRLTVRELRALSNAHALTATFHPATPEHGRGYAGRCACGVAFSLYRSAQEIGDAHADHVKAEELAARRERARTLAGLR